MKTAYPQIKGTCSIRLYSNIPFDNTYQHHTLISREFKYNNINIYSPSATDIAFGLPKERFINRWKNATTYYYPRYDLTGDFNFDFSNGLIASVVLELTPAQTNANYLRLTCGDDVYYYFITGIQQINYETYKLSLELDVLMTYQDEFLEGMKDVPVFTQRKHCHRYTDDGLYPHSSDLLSNEDVFAGIKTNHIKDVKRTTFSQGSANTDGITWLYICCDTDPLSSGDTSSVIYTMFKSHETIYPLSIIALPLNVSSFVLKYNGNTLRTISNDDIIRVVQKLINDGSIHGAKISKYPPVPYKSSKTTYISGTLTFNFDTFSEPLGQEYISVGTINNTSFTWYSGVLPSSAPIIYSLLRYGILVNYEFATDHYLKAFTSEDLDIIATSTPIPPSITSARYEDVKLLFSPFTKYKLNCSYSSDGVELYPEMYYANVNQLASNEEIIALKTITSCYIGDNNIFTYLVDSGFSRDGKSYYPYHHYNLDKIGLASSMNYITPIGENALDVFNSTQAQAFYQSKTASGITSGLTMAGGIASIAIGSTMTGASGGALTPMGMGLVASGVTAIAGGTAGVVNAIKSANAKIQDLKNTPDSINISGSNYTTDMGITYDRALPYIIISECSPVIKHNADDYFYNYGYQVARECYFNTALDFTNGLQTIDNNLIGRTIFNYVQLQEDITNKINYDMPLIIKQKLSSIFNNGITLWSFFGNTSLWSLLSTPSTNNNPDKWFMKCELDNTEYNIMKNNE